MTFSFKGHGQTNMTVQELRREFPCVLPKESPNEQASGAEMIGEAPGKGLVSL